jgi:hypothetical protein
MKSIGLIAWTAGLLVILTAMPSMSAAQDTPKAEGDAPLRANPLDLTDQTYVALRDFILPKAEELRWQQIPWRPTWAEAVAAAKKDNKPIYVWAMNGHPLGNC